MKTTDFPRLLSDFLLKELPGVRNQSSNTIASYRDTYIRLLTYCRDILSIKPEKLRVSDLTAERITEYLNWLEQECNNSISTRNQRLAAIHSLFRYIQMQAPEYMFQCQQILGIPYKKAEKHQVGYLSEADLCVGDLRLDCPAQVKLTGKGRKTRSVPLMDKTVVLLKNYLLEQRLDTPSSFEHPLFFNSQGKKLSRQGIAYILKKYANECGIDKISPHGMRHTKAMHLTEADVNPIFIRDFLGHTDLKVTEIYSKTSIKMKKAALDKMKSGKDVIPEKPLKDWTEDKSLLDWLNGLKH